MKRILDFIRELKKKQTILLLFDLILLISPGFVGIQTYRPDLFQSIDLFKLVLLSLGFTFPIAFAYFLVSAKPYSASKGEETFLSFSLGAMMAGWAAYVILAVFMIFDLKPTLGGAVIIEACIGYLGCVYINHETARAGKKENGKKSSLVAFLIRVMHKIALPISVIAAFVLMGYVLAGFRSAQSMHSIESADNANGSSGTDTHHPVATPAAPAVLPADYKNIAYSIDGTKFKLVNGVAEAESDPGSASKTTVEYFGNEFRTDLNGDGKDDIVFIVTQQSGGSGTYFYVVAAVSAGDGYVGSDGYFLGDRIAPQNIGLSQNPRHKNVIVVNYADRAKGDPMATPPSIGKSAYIKLDLQHMQWGIVEPDFQG